MLSEEEARAIVLRFCEGEPGAPGAERWAIQWSTLSPRRDHWVFGANTADYVVHGMQERARVGVTAFLVDRATGELKALGGHQGWDAYLEEKYDLEAHGDLPSLLRPLHAAHDKAAILALRKKLGCSLADARLLLSERCQIWLRGHRCALEEAQRSFGALGIETEVVPLGGEPTPEGVVELGAESARRDDVTTWVEAILHGARRVG